MPKMYLMERYCQLIAIYIIKKLIKDVPMINLKDGIMIRIISQYYQAKNDTSQFLVSLMIFDTLRHVNQTAFSSKLIKAI